MVVGYGGGGFGGVGQHACAQYSFQFAMCVAVVDVVLAKWLMWRVCGVIGLVRNSLYITYMTAVYRQAGDCCKLTTADTHICERVGGVSGCLEINVALWLTTVGWWVVGTVCWYLELVGLVCE